MSEAKLRAKAGLDSSEFTLGVERMGKQVQSFSSGQLHALGGQIAAAFTVGAVVNFAKETMDLGHKLEGTAKAFGVNVESLQALRVLFRENGREMDEVDGVLNRLSRSMREATNSAEIAEAFKKLGISAAEIADLKTDEMLMRIAKAASDGAGDLNVQQAAGKLLGKTYGELQGVMQSLAETTLPALKEGLLATSEIMSGEAVRAAAQMDDAFERSTRRIGTFFRTLFVTASAIPAELGARWGAAGNGSIVDEEAVRQAVSATLFGEQPNTPNVTEKDKAARDASIAAVQKQMDKEAEASRAKSDASNAAAEARENAADRAAEQKTMTEAEREGARRRKIYRQLDSANEDADAAKEAAIRSITVSPVSAADSMARMGAYIGGQSGPGSQVAERQLKVLQVMERYNAEQAANTKRAADALEGE